MGVRLLLLILLFGSFLDAWAVEIGDTPCDPIVVNCTCEHDFMEISVPRHKEKHVVNGTIQESENCILVASIDSACEESCFIKVVTLPDDPIFADSTSKVKSRNSKIAHMKPLLTQFYPRKLHHLSKRSSHRHHRHHRHHRWDRPVYTTPAPICDIFQMENAYVACIAWEGLKLCNITCLWGHAMEDDDGLWTHWSTTCHSVENKWKPRDFKDCEPYVLCSEPILIRPGYLRCEERVQEPSFCEIECYGYDKYESVSRKMYECKEGADYDPPELPQCVQPTKHSVKLVKKPKEIITWDMVKDIDNATEPEKPTYAETPNPTTESFKLPMPPEFTYPAEYYDNNEDEDYYYLSNEI